MIRNAKKEDITAIVELWFQMSRLHDSLDHSFILKPEAKDIFKQYAEKIIEDNEKLTIVYCADNIEGYLFAEIINQPPVYIDEEIGIINEISVSEKNRRKGIGEILLKYSEDWFKERGIKRIDCQVATKNIISTSFWKKNNYIEYSKNCSKIIK